MKIYTKKGDKGETRMLFGDAVSKDDLAPDAYGSVDELVAALGLIRADKNLPIEVQENVLRIQRELFIVGAELATTKENRKKLEPDKTLVEEKMILQLEKDIDFLEEKNGIPEFFVVPGENNISIFIYLVSNHFQTLLLASIKDQIVDLNIPLLQNHLSLNVFAILHIFFQLFLKLP